MFLAIGCSDETISGYADSSATYVLVELNGSPFQAIATIRFPEKGRVEGRGPCNTWFASQTAPYPWIELGPIAATKRACTNLGAEMAYFGALEQVKLSEALGEVLILTGNDVELVFHTKGQSIDGF